MRDVIADMGPLFLGSRLKRLGERMQAGAVKTIANAGLPFQASHMVVLAALRGGAMTIGQLADAIGISQPGVTRAIGQLAELGIVEDIRADDKHSRLVGLTDSGRQTVEQVATDIWPRIGMATEEILAGLSSPFLAQIAAIERELDKAKDYASVKRMEMLYHGTRFNWRLLKSAAVEMGVPAIDVFDANYGTVKAYHASVWMEAYAVSIDAKECA